MSCFKKILWSGFGLYLSLTAIGGNFQEGSSTWVMASLDHAKPSIIEANLGRLIHEVNRWWSIKGGQNKAIIANRFIVWDLATAFCRCLSACCPSFIPGNLLFDGCDPPTMKYESVRIRIKFKTFWLACHNVWNCNACQWLIRRNKIGSDLPMLWLFVSRGVRACQPISLFDADEPWCEYPCCLITTLKICAGNWSILKY